MNETKAYYLVIEHIQMLVQQNKISFDSKLPSERQLAATLGLSRNSIREALRSLENMGIVESRHGQGSFLVNHISQSLGSTLSLLLFMDACSSKEIRQLRRSIEISAYLLAVKQIQGTQIQELSRCFNALENSSLEERATLDKQFHDTLIQFSGNRMFILLNETLSQLVKHTIQEYQTHLSPNIWKQLLSYHARILSCLTLQTEEGIHAITEYYDFIERVIKCYNSHSRQILY